MTQSVTQSAGLSAQVRLSNSKADVNAALEMLKGSPTIHKPHRPLAPDEEKAKEKIAQLLKHRGYTVWRMSDEQVKEAVALLVKLEEQTRKAAAKAFGKMGSQATACVASQLSHPDPPVRAVAAELIGHMGKPGEEHVELVTAVLRDEDATARRYAVAALGALGQPGQLKAAEVARLLRDPDADVRRTSVEALRRMGKAGHDHADDVCKLLKDPEWTVRRSAVEAVGSMNGAALKHSDDIALLLTDSEWLVRGAAAEALGRIGEPAMKHSEVIQELLIDKEWFVRNVAAESLYNLGPGGQQLLEIHHEGMRSSAAEMLATRFDPPKREAEEPVAAAVKPKPGGTMPLKPGMFAKDKKAGAKVADAGGGGDGKPSARRAATKAFHAHMNCEDAKQMAQAVWSHTHQ